MLTIATTLVLCVFASPSAEQLAKTDRERDELNGPVRSVRVETEDGEAQSTKPKPRVLEEISMYDASGRLTERTHRGIQSDCAASRSVFTDAGHGIRTEAVYWDKSLFEDNKSDRSRVLDSPLSYKQLSKLDNKGRVHEIVEYDYIGRPFGKVLYKYDDAGRVKETVEGIDSRLRFCEFMYNDKGLPGEKSCGASYDKGRDRSEYAYEYDASGNWIIRREEASNVWADGSFHESKKVTYREINYYTSQQEPQQKGLYDRFDIRGLATCTPMLIRKSGGVLQGSAIKRVEPSYPANARSARITGAVVVEVTVDEAGKVIAARAISGPPELREASVEAAKGWQFWPTTLSKAPVKVVGTIKFNFNL